MLPRVSVLYSNGNLLQDVAAIDGIAAIVGTGKTAGMLGVPKTVYNLADAVTQGFTQIAEPDMYRHLSEFYAELAGNQELKVMVVPDTMTLTDMLDDTNAAGAKKLIAAAGGKVRLLGVYRKPAAGYVGGANFIDADVVTAITKAKGFGDARLAELIPLRIMIEGRVQNPAAPNTLTPNTSTNGYAGVVLGGSLNDGSASVGAALGRAVRYGAHIKVGKVANGPLALTAAFIGDKPVDQRADLATLHDAGFLVFMKYAQKAGFYFGRDNMCSTDDYRLLAYGRVVDKAAVIAAAVYTDEIESEVDVDVNGNIAEVNLKHLEGRIRQQINVAMGNQISGLDVYINPAQNIINTGKLTVRLRIRPKGYTTFIDVDLGLTAPAV
jgi:hypothetical protein